MNEIQQLRNEIAELRSLLIKGDFSSRYINEKTNIFKKEVRFLEQSSTPSGTPASGTEARIYIKANKIIFQWNDGGTVRYKYLDLTGTGVTWVHTTTAP